MTIAPGPRHRSEVLHLRMAEVTEALCELLPSALVASLAGVKDSSQVRKWARGDLEPTLASAARMRFTLEQAWEIEAAESARVAQAWLTTANRVLGYELPIKAIRDDRFAETAAAAMAFLEDSYEG